MDERKRFIICLVCIMGFFIAWAAANVNLEKLYENEPARLWCFAPSVVETGEEFEITIQAWDKFEQLVIQYDQEITIKDYIINETTGELKKNIDSGSYSFPNGITFKPSLFPRSYFSTEYYLFLNDGGSKKIEDIKLETPGYHYLKIESSDGFETYSNPILVDDNPKYFLYWGDIHGHTDYSDGTGTPEFAYKYARDVACVDFAAVTDHDSVMRAAHPGTWELDKAAANRYNDDGEFVTLVAYEWTRGFGYSHINVYYKGDDGPLYDWLNPEYKTTNKVLKALTEWKEESPSRDVIAIPHHPTSSQNYMDWSYDWRDIDPDIMPLVEMYSVHGSGEMSEDDGNKYVLNYLKGTINALEEGYHIQSALSMGYKIGFMGSSDTHDARLGHPLLHVDNYGANFPFSTLEYFRAALPFPGSLTGCWAEELTRDEIFDGLKERKTYATTHVSRPLVQFSINNVSYGSSDSSIKVATPTSNRHISVRVAIDGNYKGNEISSVRIVKNNEDWAIFDEDGFYYKNGTQISTYYSDDQMFVNLEIDDTETITGMGYNDGEYKDGKYWITDDAKKGFSERPTTEGEDVYYIRVTDTFKAKDWNWKVDWDGNQAWVGPIWVKSA